MAESQVYQHSSLCVARLACLLCIVFSSAMCSGGNECCDWHLCVAPVLALERCPRQPFKGSQVVECFEGSSMEGGLGGCMKREV